MLTTRCSACSTEFRVTELQLTARNGWVRCGKCMTVFDARRALIEPVADDAAARGTSDSPSAPDESAAREYGTDAVHESMPNLDISAGSGIDLLASSALEPEYDSSRLRFAKTETPYDPQSEVHPPEEEMPGSEIDAAPRQDARSESHVNVLAENLPERESVTDSAGAAAEDVDRIDALDAGPEQNATPDSGSEEATTRSDEGGGESATAVPGAHESAVEAAPMATEPVMAPEPQDPVLLDFGPKPHKRRTALWIGGIAALLIALGAQAAFQYRGTIALLLPETKPYLEEFCAALGCELPLPRRSELLSIETSDLQGHPNNPGVMVLAATLRNRAPFPQAYPALELTLTDDRDQPLARRVLQPGDYLGQNASRAESRIFAPSSEQPVRVFIEASALKATSYRLYLFHP